MDRNSKSAVMKLVATVLIAVVLLLVVIAASGFALVR